MSVIVDAGLSDKHLPRLCWRSLSGTITASSETEGFEAAFAATPQTYTGWVPAADPASWEIDLGAPKPVDYCAIGAHELGWFFASVDLQIFTAGSWLTIAGHTTQDNSAILFLFPAIDFVQRWRVRVLAYPISFPPRIGNIRFGVATKLPQRATFAPSLPITESERFEYRTNLSDTGEWLGRSIRSAGLDFSITADHVSEDFAAGEWAAFRNHCNTGDGTFYVAPRPADYPSEVAYAWPSGVVRSERTVSNAAISRRIELQCRGYRPL